MHLMIGQAAPPFSTIDSKGNPISSTSLLEHCYVLYFYPKDDTPGCTTEACSFRDNKISFDKLHTRVIGVSADNSDSHHQFEAKHNLNFTLIPDIDHHLCELFGVWKEKTNYGKSYMGIERATFLIDEKGIIRWKEQPVKVEGHTERVLEALKRLDIQKV